MDKPISVGDLVMQITKCCSTNGRGAIIGLPWRVTAIDQSYGRCPCGFGGTLLTYAHGAPKVRQVYVGWLKRIPPLDELESEQRKEELHA